MCYPKTELSLSLIRLSPTLPKLVLQGAQTQIETEAKLVLWKKVVLILVHLIMLHADLPNLALLLLAAAVVPMM